MNAIIATALRLTGLGALLEKVNGSKTYIGAAATILGGLGAALKASSCLLQEISSAADSAAIVGILRHLPQDQCFQDLSTAFAAVGAGLAAIGLRHAIEKQDATPALGVINVAPQGPEQAPPAAGSSGLLIVGLAAWITVVGAAINLAAIIVKQHGLTRRAEIRAENPKPVIQRPCLKPNEPGAGGPKEGAPSHE